MAPSLKQTISTTSTTSTKQVTSDVAEKTPVVVEVPKDDVEGGYKSKDDVLALKQTEEENNPVSIYVSKLNKYVGSIASINKELKELVTVGKSLEKDFNNIVRIMAKKSKTKGSGERRHPSGFAVASILSEEMYSFLDITNGEKVPRKDVTRMINEYITKNGLRDVDDKRIIMPNENLHKIFKSNDESKITYFNLQSYIKHHFIKEQQAVST